MNGNRQNEERRKLQQKNKRELLQKKRRRRRVLLCCMLISVFLILIILVCKNTEPSEEPGLTANDSYSEESAESAGASPDSTKKATLAESADASSDAAETISLSQSQIHTGDLILVNSDYPYHFDVNADLIDLVKIKSSQSFDYPVDKDEFQLASRVMPHLDAMIRDCDEACGASSGEVSISSAYRSKEYQEQVLQEITDEYGEDYASAYVAAPGYSEHHTGLAVDLGITLSDGTAGSFTGSDQAAWISAHCAEYGFVRRYPEDKADVTGISNESWHFRYVGFPHAKYMADNNLVLEEYLEYLKSSTSESGPLQVQSDDGTFWSVWYTEASSFEVPEGSWTVSGDNIAGYIITVMNS